MSIMIGGVPLVDLSSEQLQEIINEAEYIISERVRLKFVERRRHSHFVDCKHNEGYCTCNTITGRNRP